MINFFYDANLHCSFCDCFLFGFFFSFKSELHGIYLQSRSVVGRRIVRVYPHSFSSGFIALKNNIYYVNFTKQKLLIYNDKYSVSITGERHENIH